MEPFLRTVPLTTTTQQPSTKHTMATATEHRERAHNPIFVSNRLPFTIKKEDGLIQQELSNGDLVTALAGLVKSSNIQWFGAPGIKVQNGEEKRRVGDKLKETNATAVFLEDTLAHEHYNVFSSACELLFLGSWIAADVCRFDPLADSALPIRNEL